MRVGLYLGVSPGAGGMFQYAQSILDALAKWAPDDWELCAAYLSEDWSTIVARYPRFLTQCVPAAGLAAHMSAGLMAARIPPSICRILAPLNPAARTLSDLACDIWLFPSQDALSFQTNECAVVTIHDLMHRYEPSFPEVSQSGRFAIREHRFSNIAKTAKMVFVDSEIGKQQVVDSYDADITKITSLPYIPPAYIYETSVPADFSERYKLPSKFLFYPAQFWGHKNHRNLLLALKKVRDNGFDARVVFSGRKSNQYDAISSLVHDLGIDDYVLFAGYVPDEYLKGFYQSACGMVYPTAFGPTNIPPLEAFVCGCPVAASKVYGMEEQLGDAALLFDPSDVDAIAAAITRLWTDDKLCKDLQLKGRARAAEWGREQFGGRLINALGELSRK